ncbi:hypothetical protein GGI05_007092 [Coemansia sp. RSA 2603]|nr:hypothetical protein GGI05_007092 [Coemansia sp. RSA 2603]
MSQGVQHSSKSATTASTVKSSPAKTHSAGANGSTTGASANATSSQSTTAAATASAASAMSVSVGQQLRQSALLPYALVPETVPYVHLYLWLDILLSLSSDAQFVEQLERTTIDFWAATPQPLHKPALSHCLIVESMRIFQLNIMLLKDSQIHALSLGILANVLGRSTHISTAITQKLLKLFEMIHKRYSKIATPSRPGEQSVDEHDEQGVYAQTLAVLLTLFCHLSFTNNAQFIYGLLQAREITGVFGVSPNGADGEAVERAARAAAELRVRVAYFHALVSALPSPQQAKDILSLVESVVAKGDADSVTRVDMVSRAPGDDEWSAFLLPLVWELLLSSNIATVAELRTQFLEEFENLVL